MLKQEKGFTLAEIVAGVVILMILATVVGLAVFGYIKDARVASLKEEAIAVENDLLTNAGSYDYEGKEASELSEEVRQVLGYHESKDTKLEGLVFEDKALRSEGEVHVGKLSMPEEELGNYDFSESGVKQMTGNGIGDEFYVYDELGQVESNVGLLGDGTLTLPGGSNESRESLSAGGNNSLYVSDLGEVYSWGRNKHGQLGDGSTVNSSTPIKVSGLSDIKVKEVVTGGYYNLVLTESGEIYSWGYNGNGQLGDGSTTDRYTPVKVSGLNGIKVKEVVSGGTHSIALAENGEVYSWGRNNYGQLGVGNTTNRSTPVKVSGLNGIKVKEVVAGSFHSLLLTESGEVYGWGHNGYGELGDGSRMNSSTPVKVSGLSDIKVKEVVAGGYYSLLLTESGEVYAWGMNYKGQLGDGSTTHRSTPVKVSGLSDVKVKEVVAGDDHNIALTESGEIYSWGRNNYGQLGDGSTTNSSTPIKVSGLSDIKVKEVVTGSFHSLALTESGELYSWGVNHFGQLGDGSTTRRYTPVKTDLLD